MAHWAACCGAFPRLVLFALRALKSTPLCCEEPNGDEVANFQSLTLFSNANATRSWEELCKFGKEIFEQYDECIPRVSVYKLYGSGSAYNGCRNFSTLQSSAGSGVHGGRELRFLLKVNKRVVLRRVSLARLHRRRMRRVTTWKLIIQRFHLEVFDWR